MSVVNSMWRWRMSRWLSLGFAVLASLAVLGGAPFDAIRFTIVTIVMAFLAALWDIADALRGRAP